MHFEDYLKEALDVHSKAPRRVEKYLKNDPKNLYVMNINTAMTAKLAGLESARSTDGLVVNYDDVVELVHKHNVDTPFMLRTIVVGQPIGAQRIYIASDDKGFMINSLAHKILAATGKVSDKVTIEYIGNSNNIGKSVTEWKKYYFDRSDKQIVDADAMFDDNKLEVALMVLDAAKELDDKGKLTGELKDAIDYVRKNITKNGFKKTLTKVGTKSNHGAGIRWILGKESEQ